MDLEEIFNQQVLAAFFITSIVLSTYLGFGHYYKWPDFISQNTAANRIFCYSWGTFGLMAAIGLTALLADLWRMHITSFLILFLAYSFISFLVVTWFYYHDHSIKENGQKRRRLMASDR